MFGQRSGHTIHKKPSDKVQGIVDNLYVPLPSLCIRAITLKVVALEPWGQSHWDGTSTPGEMKTAMLLCLREDTRSWQSASQERLSLSFSHLRTQIWDLGPPRTLRNKYKSILSKHVMVTKAYRGRWILQNTKTLQMWHFPLAHTFFMVGFPFFIGMYRFV